MTDSNRKPKLMSNWSNNQTPRHNSVDSSNTDPNHEEMLEPVPVSELRQGELYIIKIKLIAIGLFQGWDDDMCCFFLLRTDRLEELRWSEARYSKKYLPENFDVYHAFDYAGNPPIHLWTRHLKAVIPINWFNIFEEARHMQRQWNLSYWEPHPVEEVLETIEEKNTVDDSSSENIHEDTTEIDESTVDVEDVKSGIQSNKSGIQSNKSGIQSNKSGIQSDKSNIEVNKSMVTKPMAVTKVTTAVVAQRHQTYPIMQSTNHPYRYTASQKIEKPAEIPTQAMAIKQSYTNRGMTNANQEQEIDQKSTDGKNDSALKSPKTPEIKTRRSFPFFTKKKKSVKSKSPIESENSSLKNTKRKSLPPSLHKKEEVAVTETPSLPSSSEYNMKKDEPITPAEDATVPPSKYDLFDLDSYFDMQATFAFLNDTTVKSDMSALNYNSVSTK
ncbi:hypothetical protein BDB01DRAFT_908582 [Pilobolus umbonatus]|nr:hypothetical protein BDB01DRAFT_908582 [Pilobolus umbonatus]